MFSRANGSWVAGWVLLVACTNSTNESKKHMDIIELRPGRSIGEIRLGMTRAEVPAQAVLTRHAGQLGPIRFLFADERVEDIWVEGLETGTLRVRIAGKLLAQNGTVSELTPVLGTCARLDATLGGTFYNCQTGVAIGLDVTGKLTQVRVKHR